MSEYIKVNEVETVESRSSTAMMALIVAILAIVVIGAVIWQPWAVAPVQNNSSTTIRESTVREVPASGSSTPIIVNPPAQASTPPAGDTNVTINNGTEDKKSTTGSSDSNTGN